MKHCFAILLVIAAAFGARAATQRAFTYDSTLTPARGNIGWYDGTNWLFVATGTNGTVLTIVGNVPLFATLVVDDDAVQFDDVGNLWTATTIGAALEELNDSINGGVPNGTGAKVHWSQLLGVPAGFADGSDDGAGGGSGTVTSVALSLPGIFSVSGSPVTVSGTLTGSLASQATNTVFAGPASGSSAAPSFRALVTNDLPSTVTLDAEAAALYQPLDPDLTDLADGSLTGSKVGSGINDDNIDFDDADNLWTATTIGAALEELNDPINGGVPNGAGAKVDWSQLTGVPAGFADNTDDTGGGGGGLDLFDARASTEEYQWNFIGNTTTLALGEMAFTALSSGAIANVTATYGRNGVIEIKTATGAALDTGGVISINNACIQHTNVTRYRLIATVVKTNGCNARIGFFDTVGTGIGTDSFGFLITNNIAVGTAVNNGSQTLTTNSFVVEEAVWYSWDIRATNDLAYFRVYTNNVTAWAGVINSGLPVGGGRATQPTFGAWNSNTANTNGTAIFRFDWLGMQLTASP